MLKREVDWSLMLQRKMYLLQYNQTITKSNHSAQLPVISADEVDVDGALETKITLLINTILLY